MNKYSRKQIVYVSTVLYNIFYINDIDSKTKALCFIQQDSVGEIPKKEIYRKGVDKTGKHCKNTAKHAANMLTHHGHVPVSACTISIKWKFQTNPYQSSEQQVAGAGGTS